LSFDRGTWRTLIGELLLFAADDIPEIPDIFATLALLLDPMTPWATDDRQAFGPWHRLCRGTRDLRFGGVFYRPEKAGINDVDDVCKLAAYLATIDLTRRTPADLQILPGLDSAEDRAGELEFIKDAFPTVRRLYEHARQHRQVIICEEI
jgi:hypothetical protein